MNRFLVGAALLGLTACGGGSGSGAGGGGGGSTSYDDYEAALGALLTDPMYTSLDPTPTSDIPSSGTAAYTGYALGDTHGGTSFLGEAELLAQFATNSVDGVIRNVVDETNQPYAGQINVAATIDRSADPDFEYQLNGIATGTLTAMGESYDISGTGTGDFFGPDYRALAFEAIGTMDDGTVSDPLYLRILAVK